MIWVGAEQPSEILCVGVISLSQAVPLRVHCTVIILSFCYSGYSSSFASVPPGASRSLRIDADYRTSFLDSQGIALHNLAPQMSLNPHFPPPYTDSGVVPLSGQCECDLLPYHFGQASRPVSSATSPDVADIV